ncbi:S-adenosyl-L-methionine-dependent methyltransferase [Abortiporus biennis]|nr:S-adenosyl-L-methionine-dependent methyltransferase [Abortiporus biennis]
MATFGRATYNAAKYASIRPTYPRQLYDYVFKYHQRIPNARWITALDLGCGTGQATLELIPFRHIIGVDPSAKMIEQAKQSLPSEALPGQLEYVQSPAEDLPFLKDGSVDLVTSAQAAHWFNWSKLWPEISRVLRKDGSVALWGYSEFRLSNYPSTTSLIHEYSQGSDPETSLGPHWERPGRTIVDNHLIDIPDPTEIVPGAFKDVERIYFTGNHYPELPNPRPVILRKKMTWESFYGYLGTFSSLHTFHEKYPEDLNNPNGDISMRFLRNLQQFVAKEDGKDKVADTDEIDVEWPLASILAKRA